MGFEGWDWGGVKCLWGEVRVGFVIMGIMEGVRFFWGVHFFAVT